MTNGLGFFESARIGGTGLRNRLAIAPIETGIEQTREGIEELAAFYERRAADRGAGMIVLSGGIPHFTGKRRSMDETASRSWVERFKPLTEKMRACDTRTILQLRHHGAAADHPFALSASKLFNPETLRTAHRAPGPLLSLIVKSYGRAAYRAVRYGGFDGVEIYGGTLSLPNVFFSPETNRRNDAWGGAARARLAREIVECVKSYLGPTPVLSYRLNLMDLSAKGAPWREIVDFADALVEAGVNHFSFDFGLFSSDFPVDDPMEPAGVWTPFMERLAHQTKVPVSFGLNLGSPETMEALLERHPGCLVELSRPFIADPDWSRKIADQTPSDIRPCARCPNGCRTRGPEGMGTGRIFCPMNPVLFSERVSPVRKPGEPAPGLLVVGAGPAGLMTACTAARRGFDVELLEARERIGGGLLSAARTEPNFERILEMFAKQLERVGVTVRTGVKVDAAWLAENACGRPVVLATGVRSRIPEITGIESPNVLTFEELLLDEEPVGRRVAVIGDTPLGRKLVRFLIRSPRERETTREDWLNAWGVGDPSRFPGGMFGFIPFIEEPFRTVHLVRDARIREQRDLDPSLYTRSAEQWMLMNDTRIVPDAFVEDIDRSYVQLRLGKNELDSLRVDHVVLAAGFEPNDEAFEHLGELEGSVLRVGALEHPNEALNLSHALTEGWKLAARITPLKNPQIP